MVEQFENISFAIFPELINCSNFLQQRLYSHQYRVYYCGGDDPKTTWNGRQRIRMDGSTSLRSRKWISDIKFEGIVGFLDRLNDRKSVKMDEISNGNHLFNSPG